MNMLVSSILVFWTDHVPLWVNDKRPFLLETAMEVERDILWKLKSTFLPSTNSNKFRGKICRCTSGDLYFIIQEGRICLRFHNN